MRAKLLPPAVWPRLTQSIRSASVMNHCWGKRRRRAFNPGNYLLTDDPGGGGDFSWVLRDYYVGGVCWDVGNPEDKELGAVIWVFI